MILKDFAKEGTLSIFLFLTYNEEMKTKGKEGEE
jgi:hypothetical protein